MENLTTDTLTIAVQERDSRLRCDWTGLSQDRQPLKILQPFFDELLELAQAKGIGVDMHFEDLENFNSSTITALIRLVQVCRSRQIQLSFSYDPDRKWQQLGFEAMMIFDKKDELFQLCPV